jgi:hypothetical protein
MLMIDKVCVEERHTLRACFLIGAMFPKSLHNLAWASSEGNICMHEVAQGAFALFAILLRTPI